LLLVDAAHNVHVTKRRPRVRYLASSYKRNQLRLQKAKLARLSNAHRNLCRDLLVLRQLTVLQRFEL